MSVLDLAVLALSAVGVAALVGLAWRLGLRRSLSLTTEALRAIAAADAPGLEVVEIMVDPDGSAGLALLRDGRILVVRAVGDRTASRVLDPSSLLSVRREGVVNGRGALVLRFGDVGFPPLRVAYRGVEAPAWVERLLRPSA